MQMSNEGGAGRWPCCPNAHESQLNGLAASLGRPGLGAGNTLLPGDVSSKHGEIPGPAPHRAEPTVGQPRVPGHSGSPQLHT